MELANYIKNLLYNHDIVIIPNFGAILTKYKSAEINSADNSITPPSKYVIFDNKLIISDGLLVDQIAQQKSISKQESEQYIALEVKLMNQKLDSGETIMLEGIGYLSKEGGIVRFERELEANFFTDSFGLSKIDYKTVEFKLAPQQTSDTSPVQRKKSYMYVYLVLIIIIIFGSAIVVYLFYPHLISRFLKRQQFSMIQAASKKDTNTLISNQKDTTGTHDLERFFDKATDKKKALAIKQGTTNSDQKRLDVNYYIIVGSFKNFERASKFTKHLDKKGYKGEVIQFNQETFRVSVGEYKDKNQALAELEKIRTAIGADAAWLLSK